MIVRTLDDVKQRDSYGEKAGVWTSARYLQREDGVGFTMTQTTCAAGQTLVLEYKNHVEANMVISGKAKLTDVATGETYQLEAGSMYTLDRHDRHTVEVIEDLHLVCVFTPALTGKKTHDVDGSYPVL